MTTKLQDAPMSALSAPISSASSSTTCWQAQAYFDDGEFDGWACIGRQTMSKNVIRRVLTKHLASRPDDKVRVRKIVMRYEPADLPDFLSQTKTPTHINMRTSHSLARELLAGPDLPVRIMEQGQFDEDRGPALFEVATPDTINPHDSADDEMPPVVVLDIASD